jgi:uncharacterized protein (PEP-CTERM system associated)
MAGLIRRWRWLVFVAGCAAAASVVAADGWRGSAGLRAGVDFTDNVLLSQRNPESDAVFLLQPFVNSTWQSRLSSAQLAYGPQFAVYVDHSDLNRAWQYLRAVGSTQLVEDFVGLTVAAQANPTVANQGIRAAGLDPVANPDAWSQTASFSITPTIQFPLVRARDFATVKFNPNINWVGYGSTDGRNGLGATDASRAFGSASTLSVVSGSYFQRFVWSINYSNTLFDPDYSAGIGRVWGSLGYRFSNKYRVDLILGYDDQYANNDAAAASIGQGGGIRWQPRFTWTPDEDTSATFGVGEAFYGTDWYVSLSRKQRRFVFAVTYNTVVQNARQAVLQQQVIPFQDAFGQPIFDPIGGNQLYQIQTTPTLADATYVSNTLNGMIGFQGRRTTVTFNFNASSYDYQLTGQETFQSSGSLAATRSLSSKLSGRAELLYQRNDYGEGQGDAWDQYRLSLGLVYQLGRKGSAGLTYSLSQGSDDSAVIPIGVGGGGRTGNYDENRLALSLTYQL